MLSLRTVLHADGLGLTDVTCRHGAGRGNEFEHVGQHTVVLVRRGVFAQWHEGRRTLLDPTVAYAMVPGAAHRYEHPGDGGDDCTSVSLSPDVVAQLWGGDVDLPLGALRVTPAVDLEHRLLVAAARRGDDPLGIAERVTAVVASVLEGADPDRVASGRPATARTHRALADATRELLAADPGRSLAALARLLSVSPHHLSRVFRAQTGTTVARHRMRLRARLALERLAGGEPSVARLADELGFADQSHLVRVLRLEPGCTPAAFLKLTGAGALPD